MPIAETQQNNILRIGTNNNDEDILTINGPGLQVNLNNGNVNIDWKDVEAVVEDKTVHRMTRMICLALIAVRDNTYMLGLKK